ncbi:hypothetical protein [Bacillus subtilis]|nr:hypothetical protein [Bacillus subtilis]
MKLEKSTFIFVSDKEKHLYHLSIECPDLPKDFGRTTIAAAKWSGRRV